MGPKWAPCWPTSWGTTSTVTCGGRHPAGRALTLGALWLADRLLRVLAPPLGIAGPTDVARCP